MLQSGDGAIGITALAKQEASQPVSTNIAVIELDDATNGSFSLLEGCGPLLPRNPAIPYLIDLDGRKTM